MNVKFAKYFQTKSLMKGLLTLMLLTPTCSLQSGELPDTKRATMHELHITQQEKVASNDWFLPPLFAIIVIRKKRFFKFRKSIQSWRRKISKWMRKWGRDRIKKK